MNIHEEGEVGGETDAPLEGSSAGLFPFEARGNCARSALGTRPCQKGLDF